MTVVMKVLYELVKKFLLICSVVYDVPTQLGGPLAIKHFLIHLGKYKRHRNAISDCVYGYRHKQSNPSHLMLFF